MHRVESITTDQLQRKKVGRGHPRGKIQKTALSDRKTENKDMRGK